MNASKLIIAASIAASITTTQAAVTTYTQSAAFFAALAAPAYAPYQTETYESYSTDTEILNNGVLGSYTYSNFPTYGPALPIGFLTGRIDERDQPGANVGLFSVFGGTKSLASFYTQTSPALPQSGDYFFPGDSFTVTLPAGTQAIGLFFNIGSTTPLSTDLFINTGVGNATNGGANYDTGTGNNKVTGLGSENNLFFVGLTSDTPFTTAIIGAQALSNVRFNVDNLTTATPEPTSICLLGFGLAGIVGYSRKRTNR